MTAVNILLCLLSHLSDLYVIIGDNGSHGGEQTDKVDESEAVVEDDSSRTDGDDLLEDAGNGECDDRCTLQQSELGCRHTKGDASREEEEQGSHDSAPFVGKDLEAFNEISNTLYGNSQGNEHEEHDGSEEEDARKGIRGRRVAEEEDLGQTPAETGEEGGRDDENEAAQLELDFTKNHENDTHGHGGDDSNEAPCWSFETEKESKDKDECKG